MGRNDGIIKDDIKMVTGLENGTNLKESFENSFIIPNSDCNKALSGLRNCEDQKNVVTRMPPQSRGPLHRGFMENRNDERRIHKTQHAELSKETFDMSSITNDYRAIDKIKAKLYLESMKSHRGRGAERQFADYWYALGCYIVSEKTGNSKTIRSGSDPCANGIDGVLQSFLVTKRLRRLHNKLIYALLKQSQQTLVPQKRFQSHIPRTWNALIEDLIECSKDVKCKKLYPIKRKARMYPKKEAMTGNDFQDIFGAGCYTSVGSNILTSSNSSKVEISTDDHGHSSSNDPHRLPGLLEVEPVVKKLFQSDNFIVSGSAMGLMVVAIREYISGLLTRTISLLEDATNRQSKENFERNKHESNKGGNGSRQGPHSISPFALLSSLNYKPKYDQHLKPIPTSSRGGWERCVSGVVSDFKHS